jgi:hypothetical protein
MLYPLPTVTHVTVVDGNVADKHFHGDANLVEIHRDLWAGRRQSACSNLVHVICIICAQEAISSFHRLYLANKLVGSDQNCTLYCMFTYMHPSLGKWVGQGGNLAALIDIF